MSIYYIINDLLPFYAILRAIPYKLGGVIAMFGALLILLILPWTVGYNNHLKVKTNSFKPLSKLLFWFFVFNFLLLGWLGSQHAEEPFITLSRVCTIFYFSYLIILLPIILYLENNLLFNR